MSETKIDETNLSIPKPKKMVSRSVTIALGIICIVLIALIAYFTVTGISAQNSYNNLKNQNNQLQTWLNGNETLLTQTKTWLTGNITLLNAQITQLQTWLSGNISAYNSYVSDHSYTNEQYQTLLNQITQLQTWLSGNITAYNNIISLNDSYPVAIDKTVEEGNGAYYTFTLSANYAGYVTINVDSSTVSGTWTEVSYTSHGVNYNQEITVNVGGTSAFPVLPSSSITIGVGNGLVVGSGATETVTITYYY